MARTCHGSDGGTSVSSPGPRADIDGHARGNDGENVRYTLFPQTVAYTEMYVHTWTVKVTTRHRGETDSELYLLGLHQPNASGICMYICMYVYAQSQWFLRRPLRARLKCRRNINVRKVRLQRV